MNRSTLRPVNVRASTYSGKIETEIMIQISSNFEVGNTLAGLVCPVPARPQYPLDQQNELLDYCSKTRYV